ncbi:hypothetical protein [Xenorhabdus budapestensis]|uniref:hypothetical protein n=1 Tax=Xenorhabdus budapestensis TaxID=290110 RepID=UPI001474D74D|nr:hypothetical protein [Xenorhabdus budapestensis]
MGAKKLYAVVADQKWHSKLINYPVNQEVIKGYHQALKILRAFSPDVQSLPPDLFPVIS